MGLGQGPGDCTFIQGLVTRSNLISFRLREGIDSRGRPGVDCSLLFALYGSIKARGIDHRPEYWPSAMFANFAYLQQVTEKG